MSDNRYVVIDREKRMPLGTIPSTAELVLAWDDSEVRFSTRAGEVSANIIRNDLGVFLATDCPPDHWRGVLGFVPFGQPVVASGLAAGLSAAAEWHEAEAENHRCASDIANSDAAHLATWHDECAFRMRAAADRAGV